MLPEKNIRYVGLDLLRSMAVLFVLFSHTNKYGMIGLKRYVVSKYFGYAGVEFFFVLSGVLIGGILIRLFKDPEVPLWQSLKLFWIRRWFRTLPNYYLMLIVYFVWASVIDKKLLFTDWYYWLYAVFLQNTFRFHPAFFGPAWTLAVEEWFYLLFPMAIITAFLILRKRDSKIFLYPVLLFLFGSLLLRVLLFFTLNPSFGIGFRAMMPLRLDAIAMGVLFAWIRFYYPKFWEGKKNRFLIGGIIGLVLLSVYFCWYFYSVDSKGNFFLKTIFFSLFSLSIASLLPYLYSLKVQKPKLLIKGVTWLSKISYSVYLTNWLFVQIADHYLLAMHGWVKILFVFGSTFTVSFFQYKYFEKTFTDLRDKFTPSQKNMNIFPKKGSLVS